MLDEHRLRSSSSLALFVSLAASQTGCTLLFPLDSYGSGPYPAAVMSDQPVLYLRLGESSGSVAHDALGQHDGTYGTRVVLGAEGAIAGDSAATFDGSLDANVAMPSGFDFAGTAAFSVEVWARQTSLARFGWTIDHQVYGNREGWGLSFGTEHTAFERWGNNTYAGPNVFTNGTLELGTYHHVVGTFDGNAIALYVDGQLVDRRSGGTPINATAGGWQVGRQNCGCVSDNFIGSLDELAIYDRALDGDAVLAHYQAAGR